MSATAVKAHDIGKLYRIGVRRRHPLLEGFSRRFRLRPRQLVRAGGGGGPGYIWALKEVSLEIPEGEVFGIIGRNGSGKSTLLKILSRITEPTEGQAELHGRVGSLLEVGTGFHPDLTGRDNVYLNGALLGMTRREIQRSFDEIVDFAGISKFIDTPVKYYSSGMYVRLGFSVAAHLKSEILIIDEVLAVGDVAFQRKCLGSMEGAAKSGRTVLFVSHNMASVKNLCHRAMLLEGGRCVAEGPSADIVVRYLNDVSRNDGGSALTEGSDGENPASVRLCRARIAQRSRADGSVVLWKEPIEINLEIEVLREVRDAVVGIGIVSVEAVPVLTVHHNDRGNPVWSFAPGRYRISVKLENPLRAGWYTLVVGAHEAIARGTIFYVPEALRFEVAEVAAGDENYIQHNTGLVNGEASWTGPEPLT